MSTLAATTSLKTLHDEPAGVGWLLLAAAFALPWLLPIHLDPWTTFYGEVVAAAVLVPVAIWALVARSNRAWRLDFSSIVFAGLALIPLVQASAGLFAFGGEAWLISLYLCAVAAALVLARHAQEVAPHRLIDALFSGVLIAALLSTAMAIYQWFGLSALGDFVLPLTAGGRAAANLAQPNNLSTLLAWGIVAAWWTCARGRLGPVAAGTLVFLLLLGVALTRSRTGWMLVGALAMAATLLDWERPARPNRWLVAALAAWFVLLVVGLEPASQYLWREAPATVSSQASLGKRPLIWQLALTAIANRPWFGYGWYQSVQAHVELIDTIPSLHTTVLHAHNVVLDLLLWNGVPIGLLLIVALALWSWRRWRAATSPESRLVLLALALFGVHAMLELPHAYAFFLLPAAVMVGTLNAMSRSPTIWVVPRAAIATAVLVLGAVLVLCVRDYQAIERDLLAARMRAAGIYNPNPSAPAEPIVLGFLQTALVRLRTEPTAELPAEQLADLRRTLDRYPSLGGLFRYAQACALRGQPDEARWAMERLCLLNAKHHCDAALRDWRELAAQGHPEMNAVVLPTSR